MRFYHPIHVSPSISRVFIFHFMHAERCSSTDLNQIYVSLLVMSAIGILPREKPMESEDQDGIKTVECLRGRLLAERMASKTAKAEADLLAEKLADLEKQLEEELERRGRAEKKLKHALKKLPIPGRMDLSDSSDGSWNSGSSGKKEDSLADEVSNSNGYLEVADATMRQSSKEKSDIKRPVEESLALVPVSIPEEPAAYNPEAKNNVHNVLFSLRYAREQLKSSMGRTVALYSTKEPRGRQRASTVSMEVAATK